MTEVQEQIQEMQQEQSVQEVQEEVQEMQEEVQEVQELAKQDEKLENNGLYNKLQRVKYFWGHNRSPFSNKNIEKIGNIIKEKIENIENENKGEKIESVFDEILNDDRITFSNIKMLVFGAEHDYKKFNNVKDSDPSKNNEIKELAEYSKIFTEKLLEKAESTKEAKENIYNIVDEKFKNQKVVDSIKGAWDWCKEKANATGNWFDKQFNKFKETKVGGAVVKAGNWLLNNKVSMWCRKLVDKVALSCSKLGDKIKDKWALYKENRKVQAGMKLLGEQNFPFNDTEAKKASKANQYFVEENSKFYKYYKDVNDYNKKFKKDSQLTEQDKENGITNIEEKKENIWMDTAINFAQRSKEYSTASEILKKFGQVEEELKEAKLAEITEMEQKINEVKIISDDLEKEEVEKAENKIIAKSKKEVREHMIKASKYNKQAEILERLASQSFRIGNKICDTKTPEYDFETFVRTAEINEDMKQYFKNINQCYNELEKELDTYKSKEIQK